MAVLESGKVNQWTGDQVRRFEDLFARRFQAPHAVAVFNGTVALELALRALGVGPGDEVIVAARSFVASASCVMNVGATPVFADIDETSLAISVETIAPQVSPRTRAIIPVHLAGWPADMLAIMELASRHGLLVIEDCAQSHGAAINGRPLGSFGHAAAFSFCQDKIMTTGGEGGMVLFQDESAFARAWSYKDHGKSIALRRAGSTSGKPFRYVHDDIGSNWRMTEMQAAIGIRQLDKLDGWVRSRTRHAAQWRSELAGVRSVRQLVPDDHYRHAYYRAMALLQPDAMRLHGRSLGSVHAEVLDRIGATGAPVTAGGCPEIYREAAFAHLQVERRQVAFEIGERSLALPVHPTLTPRIISQYAARVRAALAPFTLE